jgi:hypothetical protein
MNSTSYASRVSWKEYQYLIKPLLFISFKTANACALPAMLWDRSVNIWVIIAVLVGISIVLSIFMADNKEQTAVSL